MEKEHSELCRNAKYHSIQIHPEHGAYLLGTRYGASIEYDPFTVMDQILYALASYLCAAQSFLPVTSDIHPVCSFHFRHPFRLPYDRQFRMYHMTFRSAANLHFLTNVFLHFITGADTGKQDHFFAG
ncbi:hypothetical protein OBV_08750 [Oscillibacter valericigenes Sjm18-20]|nr:hypothetical protein OBV_08750 [Oscillibacter valericigenes Sjm18-20]